MVAYGSAVPEWESLPDHVLLARAGQTAGRFHQQVAAEHGLTVTALGVLDELGRAQGGWSHREIAAALGITPATLTPVVDALVAAGDLVREPDPLDRRVVRLSITRVGRRRLAAAGAAVAAAVAARMPVLPGEHAAIVRSYLIAVLARR
jgi:DNA-binding MarR family transcriptional regulator